MSAVRVVEAQTARARTARGGSAAPVVHASVWPPEPYSPKGRTYRAVCGAQVRHVDQAAAFDPTAATACAKCTRTAKRLAS